MRHYQAGAGAQDGGVLDYVPAGPTVARMLLGAQLRRLRETACLTRGEAGQAIRASASKISRLELGRTSFKERDVTDLLALYGVGDEAERATLTALARRANIPGWWRAYGNVVPSWFEPYLGLEDAASIIRTYDVQFIPSLLQTADYARAALRLGCRGALDAEIERRVSLRMRRQQLLRRARPPHLWAVIDEAALRRPLGGPATMRAQIQHLIETAESSCVTVQVLPFSAGGHAAAGGPITLLRFPESELPDVVYLEQLISAVYPDKPSDIQHYWNVLNRLVIEAEPCTKTIKILHQILDQT